MEPNPNLAERLRSAPPPSWSIPKYTRPRPPKRIRSNPLQLLLAAFPSQIESAPTLVETGPNLDEPFLQQGNTRNIGPFERSGRFDEPCHLEEGSDAAWELFARKSRSHEHAPRLRGEASWAPCVELSEQHGGLRHDLGLDLPVCRLLEWTRRRLGNAAAGTRRARRRRRSGAGDRGEGLARTTNSPARRTTSSTRARQQHPFWKEATRLGLWSVGVSPKTGPRPRARAARAPTPMCARNATLRAPSMPSRLPHKHRRLRHNCSSHTSDKNLPELNQRVAAHVSVIAWPRCVQCNFFADAIRSKKPQSQAVRPEDYVADGCNASSARPWLPAGRIRTACRQRGGRGWAPTKFQDPSRRVSAGGGHRPPPSAAELLRMRRALVREEESPPLSTTFAI